MRTLLTLALVACAAAPAAGQTFYYQGQGSAPNAYPVYRGPVYAAPQYYATPQYNVVVSTPRTYVAVRPSVTYGYAPTPYTYSQPTYYSQPSYYGYPQTQTYSVQLPTYATPTYSYARPPVVYSAPSYAYSTPTYSTPSYAYSTPIYAYSTPSYATTPTFTYATPTYSTTQSYTVPVSTPVYTQPMTWSQPTPSWSSYPTAVAYGPSGYGQPSGFTTWERPRYESMAWSQPTHYPTSSYSTPTMSYNYVPSYSTPSAPAQSVVVSSPFPTQPTLGFVPSGNYQQRLVAPPSYTPSYAARPVVNPYR